MSVADILADVPWLGCLLRPFPPRMAEDRRAATDSRGLILALAAAVVGPLLLLGVATYLDGRFGRGDLVYRHPIQIFDENLDAYVEGMSFIGDMLLWPLIVLAPLSLLLLKYAIFRTVDFFNQIRRDVSPGFSAEDYNRLVDVARFHAGGQGSLWATLRLFTLMVTLTICGVNAWYSTDLICPDESGGGRYASIEANVFLGEQASTASPGGSVPARIEELLRSGGRVRALEPTRRERVARPADVSDAIPVRFSQPVAYPKWDGDRCHAPLSYWLGRAARLATNLFYPLIFYKLACIVFATFWFCRSLGRVPENSALSSGQESMLSIRPLSPDRSQGVFKLTDAAIAYIYALVPFVAVFSMSFVRESVPAQPYHYLLITFSSVFLGLAVSTPLFAVHLAMKEAKRNYLSPIAMHLNALNDRLMERIKTDSVEDRIDDIKKLRESIHTLKEIYDYAENTPIWPLRSTMLYRLMIAVGSPFLVILLQQLAVLVSKSLLPA